MSERPHRPELPPVAALLLGLMRPEHREAFVGDLLEEYEQYVVPSRGRRAARRWMWAQLVRGTLTAAMHRIYDWFATDRGGAFGGGHTGGGWGMGGLRQDVRFAARRLLGSPGFTVTVVASLGLGIGANSAMFSVVDGVLLTPLPFEEPDRLVHVSSVWVDRGQSLSYPDLVDLEALDAFESLVGMNVTSATLTESGDPVMLDVARPSKGVMSTLRVAPALGRDIRPDEFGPSAPAIAVISHALWQDRYGGTPDVLGRTITLDGVRREIVGVAPAGFEYPAGVSVWTPRYLDVEGCGRGCHTMRGIGRLAHGYTLEQARAQVERRALNLAQAYPDTNWRKSFAVRPLLDDQVADVRRGLWLLLGSVALVLMIACANVAHLLLARAAGQRGELALRRALGASGARLVGQSVIESTLLVLLGGALAVGIAHGIVSLLPSLSGGQIPRLENVALDWSVLAYTQALVVSVAIVFGIAPALAASRSEVKASLRAVSTRHTDSHQEVRRLLVVGEVALCTVLLIGAGLMLESFRRLNAVDLGYDTENITRFTVSLPESEYASLDAINGFFRELESRLAGLPGVESVGSVWGPPLGQGRATGTVYVEGRPEPTPENEREAAVHSFGPGWLETMGLQVVRGRAPRADEHATGEAVALVNEQFVRETFGDEDPIGRRVRVGVSLGFPSRFHTIVGVLKDIRTRSVDTAPEAEMWMPQSGFGPATMTVSIRSVGRVTPGIETLQRTVWALDPNLPLYRVETVAEAHGRHVAPTRFYLILTAAFAVLAAVLAAVGVFSVAALAAARRTREIGLRVALGAGRRGIVRLVASQGTAPAVVGVGIGLLTAVLGARVLDAVLFDVAARDPTVYGAVGVAVIGLAALASALPARRATRIHPVEALRED